MRPEEPPEMAMTLPRMDGVSDFGGWGRHWKGTFDIESTSKKSMAELTIHILSCTLELVEQCRQERVLLGNSEVYACGVGIQTCVPVCISGEETPPSLSIMER